jgi:hypothetical protein
MKKVHPYNHNTNKRDPRTWKRFMKSYRDNGGWDGHATLDWIIDGANYLMDCGVSSVAAGKIMADKQKTEKAFVDFVVTGQQDRVIYEIPGVVKAVSGRDYKSTACGV